MFDAKVQFKSNEISQETFDLVQMETDKMLQHLKHEKDEIAKVKSRLANLSFEDMIPKVSQSSMILGASYKQESSNDESLAARLPEPPSNEPSSSESTETPVMTVSSPQETKVEPELDWVRRMNSQ